MAMANAGPCISRGGERAQCRRPYPERPRADARGGPPACRARPSATPRQRDRHVGSRGADQAVAKEPARVRRSGRGWSAWARHIARACVPGCLRLLPARERGISVQRSPRCARGQAPSRSSATARSPPGRSPVQRRSWSAPPRSLPGSRPRLRSVPPRWRSRSATPRSTSVYATWLRRVAIADIAAIAAAFVIRATAGGVATGVPISRWLFVVVSFAALFVAAGKRYGDLIDPGHTVPALCSPSTTRTFCAWRSRCVRGRAGRVLHVGIRRSRPARRLA